MDNNRDPYIKNNIPIQKDTIINKENWEKLSKEYFLSDYGILLNNMDVKNDFSVNPILFTKNDFHLFDLSKKTIQNNIDIKNCLLFKCFIYMRKLLEKGYVLEDYILYPDNLQYNLIAITKIIYFNNNIDEKGLMKNKVAKNILISYENEIKAYLKYNELILRNNKLIKNIIFFLNEFYYIKKKILQITNTQEQLLLSEDFPIETNYAIIAYEKLVVKIKHLEMVENHLKITIKDNIKELKIRYLTNTD